MAIALLITMPGATTEDYDAVMHELGLPLHTDSPNWPKGALSHIAGTADDGLYVVDVWESRADFDAFMENRLAPAMQKAENPIQPQIKQIDLYNMYSRTG